MYDWLMKQPDRTFDYSDEIKEFTAKRWKNPYDLSRKYSLFTQFICMAAYDQQQSTVLYLSLSTKPTKKLIAEVLLHFKDVKILSYGDQPFQIMLQNIRPSSIHKIITNPMHPIIEDLFGRTPRVIDEEWFPIRGDFYVKREQLQPYKSENFSVVIKQLRKYELTSFHTNFLLNERYQNSYALRYLAYETTNFKVTINENNHIIRIKFE
ncbi:MAG: hypothetical protein KBT36_12555 [Kurthia sp.]|nr:hypothetical protein [Candidatus Kurthia equi]